MKTVIATLLLVASTSQAATLKELLDSAQRNNVDQRISAESRNRAEADYRTAWASLLPSLSAQGVWTHNQYEAGFDQPIIGDDGNPIIGPDGRPTTRRLTIIAKNQLDATFRIDLPLIDTTRWFRTMAGAAQADGAAQREQATRDQVNRQVISAWYAYAYFLAVRESANRQAAVADEQAKLQTTRANAGAATELEVARARAEQQRTRQVIADTEAAVAGWRRNLRTLTGIDPGDSAVLGADDTAPSAPWEELEKNVDQLPQLRAAERDAEAAGKLATAQRLAVLPTVGAQFTERVTNAASFTGQPTSYTAGIALSWRLDAPTFMAMSSAAASESIANLSIERARLFARDQIFSDWQRLHASLQKLEAAKAQLEANQRAAQVSRDRYAAGAATQLDVITAERDLFQAEVGQIQARTELASARLALRISSGQPLQIE